MKKTSYILRELFKFKGSTLTKITSLTIGIIVGTLALSYCIFETSYDDFHKDADRLYRISVEGSEYIKAALIYEAAENIPDIEVAACCTPRTYRATYKYDSHEYSAETIYADTSFFNVFSFDVITGNPSQDLADINKIFISDKLAGIIFGTTNPVGQQMETRNGMLTIAGVFKQIPRNCHFICLDIIRSVKALGEQDWNSPRDFSGYIRLSSEATPDSVARKIQLIANQHKNTEHTEIYHFQPIRDLHLKYGWGYTSVIFVSILGSLIVIISALNYILIAISSLIQKTKEIGIHKVNGASSGDIFRMFLLETIILILIAGLLALGFLLGFRQFFEYMMFVKFGDMLTTKVICMIIGFIIFLILFTAVIPARLFASVPVLQVFRQVASGKRSWKYVLLWIQFSSAGLLITLLIIFTGQFNLIMNKDLGYNMDKLYYTEITCGSPYASMEAMKAELDQLAFVEGSTFANTIPIWVGSTTIYDENKQEVMECSVLYTDNDFFRVMEIPMIKQDSLWNENKVIVNKKFLDRLKFLSKNEDGLIANDCPVKIDGICKNFQVNSLYAPQLSLLIKKLKEPDTARIYTLLIRFNNPAQENIQQVHQKLQNMTKNRIALYSYKTTHKNGYQGEEDLCNAVQLFTAFAILITILGLFGFTGDEIARRTKEIAIRKVNGASTGSVMYLLLRNICILALLSIPFALFGSFFLGQLWLSEFAYQLTLSIWIFAGSSAITLSIIILTVFLKSRRGIWARPIEALKSE